MNFAKGTKVIDVPIFYCKLAVLDTEQKYNYVAKQGIEDEIPAWGESFGCVFTLRGENGCDLHILAISDKSVGCVAHEVFHIAVNIMNQKDIPINSDTEEVQAYLVGWLMEEVMKVINK